MLKLFYNFIIFFNVPKRGRVGVLDWSRDFGEVPEKSPIFWGTFRRRQKSPRVPNGVPGHLGTFPRSSQVPGTPERRERVKF